MRIFAAILKNLQAKVAQLVEHDLPKVGVAGSSPVFRSKNSTDIKFSINIDKDTIIIFTFFRS